MLDCQLPSAIAEEDNRQVDYAVLPTSPAEGQDKAKAGLAKSRCLTAAGPLLTRPDSTAQIIEIATSSETPRSGSPLPSDGLRPCRS